MNNSLHDFVSVLNELVDEQFPNTERYMIRGGDIYEDIEIELRQDNKRMRYSPYLLYKSSKEYEETIEKFLLQWKVELEKQ